MTTPIVTELPQRLEPVTADSFLEPAHVEHDPDRVMNYLECDLTTELTLPQWRRDRAAASAHRRHRLRTYLAPAHRGAALAA